MGSAEVRLKQKSATAHDTSEVLHFLASMPAPVNEISRWEGPPSLVRELGWRDASRTGADDQASSCAQICKNNKDGSAAIIKEGDVGSSSCFGEVPYSQCASSMGLKPVLKLNKTLVNSGRFHPLHFLVEVRVMYRRGELSCEHAQILRDCLPAEGLITPFRSHSCDPLPAPASVLRLGTRSKHPL